MKSDSFKVVITTIFIGTAVIGMLVFGGIIKIGSKAQNVGPTGRVTLWGTVGGGTIKPLIDDFNEQHDGLSIRYVQKPRDTFDQELLEAIASGTGPDLFFLPDNLAHSYANKIYTIPYTTYDLASFRNSFASAGEVFLTSKGILAFPITVDPMVMYYNRSILDTNGVIYPPTNWTDFTDSVAKMTRKDSQGQILKSAVGLGQFSNVAHAKDILAMLFMQAGSPIVAEKSGYFYSSLKEINDRPKDLSGVLSFYTSFGDPLMINYTWNKALPSSIDFFTSDNMAYYFGYASELDYLIRKNPNLNFGVASVPQIKDSNKKITSGHTLGIAISAFSRNLNTSAAVASMLTGDTVFVTRFAGITGTVPAKRELLITKPDNAYTPVFYSSALFAKSWLDPSPEDTKNIFRTVIEGILSNTLSPESAINDANGKMNLLLVK